GSELALKAAAIVATSVVVGGLGFKAVSAVATPETPKSGLQQLQGQARLFAPSVLRGQASVTPKRSDGASAFRHSSRARSGHDALTSQPPNDRASQIGRPEPGQPLGEAS